MKNWLKIFFLSFFSNKHSKQAVKKGYVNPLLSLMLALVFVCIGVIWADVLPFGTHYGNATDFKNMVRSALTHVEGVNGINVLIENGELKATRNGGDFDKALLVDTFNNSQDAQVYAKKGYQLVIDTRSADSLAEVEAYCVSTDEQQTVITYAEYLTLNQVARKNFEFKLRYTGRELILDDSSVSAYKAFVETTNQQNANLVIELEEKLSSGEILKSQFNREVYELYFASYYPSINAYESTSKVPLLRNYYFHEIIDKGADKFLMVFDDSMVGSFETDGGIEVFFYGFYNSIADGYLIEGYFAPSTKINAVDNLIKKSYRATVDLSVYIYIMNTIRLVPIITLMVIVVAMLNYSILSLQGVDACKNFGGAVKIVGSYAWCSGLISAVLTIITAFMVQKNLITIISIVAFFVTLLVRTIIFVVAKILENNKRLQDVSNVDQQPTEKTEA